MRGGQINKIIYKLPRQNNKEMVIDIDIIDTYKKVTGKDWYDLKKIQQEKRQKSKESVSKLLVAEKSKQMGEFLTELYKWEKKHAKQFKSQTKNKDVVQKVLLDIAKKNVKPKGKDKKIIVKMAMSISSELKKISREIIKKEEEEKRIKPEEGSNCCMSPGPMITGKIFYSKSPNGSWQRYQGIAFKREGRGLKGKIWGIACEGGVNDKPHPSPIWAEWNDKGGFAPTRDPNTRTGFKRWWNWQLKNNKKKLLSIIPEQERDKLPLPYKEDSNGPAPYGSIKGGKKKSKKNIRMRRTRKRKGGSKVLTGLQKAKIINVLRDKKVQQYVRENKHKTLKLRKKLGGPRKFRSFTRKRRRKIKRKKNTAKGSRKKRRKYTCRKRKNCK